MNTKKLIVNADDFGQSPGINSGIIKAYEKGVVTSASLMVRYGSSADAAAYAKNNPGLGVGLHIDLGEWVYEDGNWEPVYEVVLLGNVKKIEQEINQQLESFYRIMERKPTHIDSHQHVHQRENIRSIFIEKASKLNVPLRGCSGKVKYCGDFYGQLADGSPYHDAISISGLKRIIAGLTDGITELACHPGLKNDIETMYKYERELEVRTLCNKEIRETISNENILLCSFEGITF